MGEAKIPFLFVGNQRCLDFINTSFVVNGGPVDLLATFSDLVTWLVEVDLLSEKEGKKIKRQWAKQVEGTETLEQARAFRDTLREMVERIADGRPVPQAAIEAINGTLRYRIGYPQLTRRNGKFERGYLGRISGSESGTQVARRGCGRTSVHVRPLADQEMPEPVVRALFTTRPRTTLVIGAA